MSTAKQPCKDCKDRWVNETSTCHSVCEKYKTWKKEDRELKRRIKEKTKLDNDSYSTMESMAIRKRCKAFETYRKDKK